MTADRDRAASDAALAALIFASDPSGLVGIRLRGRAGSAREGLVAAIRELVPAAAPFRKLPLSIADDRLLGGIDLASTLKAGRPVRERGLLLDCDQGFVVAPGAERMSSALAARLAAVLDHGELVLERDGFRSRSDCRFGLIALDEGLEADEQPPAILLERLALQVECPDRLDVDFASYRHRLPGILAASLSVSIPEGALRALCQAAMALGVRSGRAPSQAIRVARIHAALHGRCAVIDEDAAAAARLVYSMRATMIPADASPPPPPPETPDAEEQSSAPQEETLNDIVLAAAQAAIPHGLLATLHSAITRPSRTAVTGSSGHQHRGNRGRSVGSRAGDLSAGKRLHVVHTLRAAAPWQRLRRQTGDERRVLVSRDDFRITRFRQHGQSLTLFVVDASGSSALHRLAEVKGAVELLLADCYVRRDQVALLAFRGQTAELLLPPTRSLPRAKRCLAGLPGGGGTPLASALDAARLMGEQARRKGQTPIIVLLTDGRANVARDGNFGREAAEVDASAAARSLRACGLTCLMIDTSPMPHAAARRLASDMQARYLPLPRADAQTLSSAVRGAIEK